MSETAAGRENDRSFFDALAAARMRVLFLDYDGTVAPFKSDRSYARPSAGVPPLLRQVMTTCSTRLIIVSGRSAREIPRLMAIHPMPEIWGSHGVERLYSDGRYEERNVAEEALQALADAEFSLDEASLGPHVEVKLAAIAVHWRGLDAADVVKIRSRAHRVLEPLTLEADLVLSEFDEGVELRLRSANKGEALRVFLTELQEGIPVAYVGDDVDDEHAFQVLNGRGLTVLVRPKPRFTAAQVVLRPPDELIGFLKQWIRACEGTA
jgi:trehalose-phosphatase